MKRKRLAPIILVLIAFLLIATLAYAQGEFNLAWWTVDSGGGRSTGADYSLEEVVGQPDAGTLHGGDFTLAGGFLNGVAVPAPLKLYVYLPAVLR